MFFYVLISPSKTIYFHSPKVLISATALATATSNISLKAGSWPKFCPIQRFRKCSLSVEESSILKNNNSKDLRNPFVRKQQLYHQQRRHCNVHREMGKWGKICSVGTCTLSKSLMPFQGLDCIKPRFKRRIRLTRDDNHKMFSYDRWFYAFSLIGDIW